MAIAQDSIKPARKFKPIPPLTQKQIANFWDRVDKSPGQGPQGQCWEWQGFRMPTGHGQLGFGDGTAHGCLTVLAHRLAFFLQTGSIDDSLNVNHVVCDNPPCCRGAHLQQGTQTENMEDMNRKMRGGHAAKRQAHLSNGANRGEKNSQAILTEPDVLHIRIIAAMGFSLSEIARSWGVKQGTVSAIANKRIWLDVKDDAVPLIE